jgi:outer membrane protein OmpA-like peptidoglycan-associated protein
MKVRVLFALLLAVSASASADFFKDPYVDVMGSYAKLDKDVGKDKGLGGGLIAGFSIARHLNLELSSFTNSVGKDVVNVSGLDAQLLLSDGKFQTFILGGGGADVDIFTKRMGGTRTSPYADVGAGLVARLTEHVGLRLEARYYALFNAEGSESVVNDFRFNFGFQFAFGTVIPSTEFKKPVVTNDTPIDGDSDGDGVPDSLDQCPNTPNGVTVDAKGCPIDGDSDGDGVPDSIDKCPGTLKGFKVDAVGCIVEQTVILRAVNFDFSSDKLTAEARSTLDQLAKSLETQPGLELQIAGHTDSLGPSGYNLTLSQKRANAVRNYLIAHEVKASRLKAEGFGEFNPIASNESEEGRAQNRRVEFKVLDKSVPAPTAITLPVPSTVETPAK